MIEAVKGIQLALVRIMDEPTDEIFKVIILNDSGVGKSCFMLQSIEGNSRKTKPTIEEVVKVNGQNIQIQI